MRSNHSILDVSRATIGGLRSWAHRPEIKQQVDEIQHVYYRVTVHVGRACPTACNATSDTTNDGASFGWP